jgi:hypothetical protein
MLIALPFLGLHRTPKIPPSGRAYVTTTGANGKRQFVTTLDAAGNRQRVTTLKA